MDGDSTPMCHSNAQDDDSMPMCLSNTQDEDSLPMCHSDSLERTQDRDSTPMCHSNTYVANKQFRTHYLMKELAYVSTQQSGQVTMDTKMIEKKGVELAWMSTHVCKFLH